MLSCRHPTITLVLVLACGCLHAADPSPADLTAAKAPENGLVVQVGARNASFLGGLTLRGKRLVHGLALDDATRAAVLPGLVSGGWHPFASISVWDAAPRLPYADRLVTLLIVDRDDLADKSPTTAECQRVVEPGGIILERVKGVWKPTVVARPNGLGDWTHFDGGADGNAVSTDTECSAIRGLQWIDNVREPRWAKTGPHGGEGGNIRVLGRYAVLDMRIYPEDKDPKFDKRIVLECRDVNNGLLIWQKPRSWDISGKRWALAVGAGQCFTWLTDDGPLTAIDMATGKALRSYPGSGIKPWLQEGKNETSPPRTVNSMQGNNHWVRVSGTTVLANGDGTLRAWTMDGKPLWSFAKAGLRLEMPTVDAQRGLVYAFLVTDTRVNKWGQGPVSWGRWSTSSRINSLIAIDLATGALQWENTDVASRDTDIVLYQQKSPLRIAFGQLLVTGDYVIAYNAKAISGGDAAFIASIDAATGKTVCFDPKTFIYTSPRGRVETKTGYCALARDGLVYVMGIFDIHSFNPRTGELKQVLSVPWNMRCHKPIATATHFLTGQTAFIGQDFSGQMYAVARSGCAHSPVPGGGLILFGPHTCACTTHFDGFLAATSHAAPEPIPDSKRLVALHGAAAIELPTATLAAAASLVGQSWPWFTISSPTASVALDKAGWTFRIDPQKHRLTAAKGGVSWSFVGDARLGNEFCVVGNCVVIAGHDGWVHGLDLETGVPRWRYFAAPAHRLIVANGMLTSAWPVMGVADLGGGRIVASAGTHVELDGGVRVVALKAEDGSQIWVKTLRKPASKIPPGGGRETKIVDRSLINAAPTVEGGKIVIAGGSHLGRVEFDSAESEESINTRLSTLPVKKK
jgi:outer membrane protein assembly factor BamB